MKIKISKYGTQSALVVVERGRTKIDFDVSGDDELKPLIYELLDAAHDLSRQLSPDELEKYDDDMSGHCS